MQRRRRNRSLLTSVSDFESQWEPQAAGFAFRGCFPSPCALRRRHPAEIQRQAHEAPLASDLAQTSQAEGSEAQYSFHPSEDGLDDGLSPPVSRATTPRRELRAHGSGHRLFLLRPLRLLALAADGYEAVDAQ